MSLKQKWKQIYLKTKTSGNVAAWEEMFYLMTHSTHLQLHCVRHNYGKGPLK